MRSVSEVIAHSSGLSLPVAARIYATAGIPVFPCVPGEKRPLTKRGFHDATTSLPVVSTWWSRWPEANIAIPTGPASGIEVVDVDINERTSGYAAFERARGQGLAEGRSGERRVGEEGKGRWGSSERRTRRYKDTEEGE